jgi:hypothetical protein
MIVRGFEMEKGVDYVDIFSPTPGLAVARLMMSLAIANDMELHKIVIEQAFLQADKLDEGVNGRYFINPPPGSPEASNKNIVYEVLGRSRMKVRTPRGHVQLLKAPCLPGGPSMPCRAAFRPPTSSLHRLRTADPQISCVCAQCARRAAAHVAPDTGNFAHAHTPGSVFTVEGAPAASRRAFSHPARSGNRF